MRDRHRDKRRQDHPGGHGPGEGRQKEEFPTISRRGRKVIWAGVGVLILGFLVLTKTDPAGQNPASILSPFLILGGYAVIGIGIVLPDPGEKTEGAGPGPG